MKAATRSLRWLPPLLALAFAFCSCNAYRALRPSTHKDRVPPEIPAEIVPPAILLYTKTNGFRHDDAIEAGAKWLSETAAHRGWSVFHTENGAVFNDRDLSRFAVAFWHNASGDTLDDAQRAAFEHWLEKGGGYVGTHAAGDGSHSWDFYVRDIVGVRFSGHILSPQFQDARVVVEDHDHPATRSLPADFVLDDEWYSFAASPRGLEGVHVLASLDESSYTPERSLLWWHEDLRMGDHPIVWWRCVGRGRVLYSAIGHQASAYARPEYSALLEGALAWAAGLDGRGCR